MIANDRGADLVASIGAVGQALGQRRGRAFSLFTNRLGVFAADDFEPATGRGRQVERREPERLAHERLDARAASAGEVRQHAVLCEREPGTDSSHIRILNIAERMQLALRGQAGGGLTDGPGHTRLPCS